MKKILISEEPLNNRQVGHAIRAVLSGKHNQGHASTLKRTKAFLNNNKGHKWGRSADLHKAISKVNIPLHAGVITRDNLIDALIEAVNAKELKKGIEVEKEHGDHDKETDVFKKPDKKSKKGFEKIAKAHLKELPDYYTRLAKMEKKGKAEKAIKEATDAAMTTVSKFPARKPEQNKSKKQAVGSAHHQTYVTSPRRNRGMRPVGQ